MYPDQNRPDQQHQSNQMDQVEYLNQISEKPKPPPLSPKNLFQLDKKFLMIGGLILVIIIVVIIAVAASSSRGVPNAELLGARMSSLSTLVKYGQGSDITDSDARQMVAEIALLQAGSKSQLSQVFGSDQGFSNPSEQVKAQESISKITRSLDDAKKIGSINAMYKEALVAKVESLVRLLKNSLPDLQSQANKNIVQDVISNYQMILDRFSN